jgi:hypothetical protein
MKKHWMAVWLTGAVLTAMPGCASKQKTVEQFRPGGGIAEYREITEKATSAVQEVLASLEVVAAQSNHCSPEAFSALSTGVQRLQVDSLRVRARSQAILARGDGYFERWHETLAMVKDQKVRALAEERRPLLQQRFEQIKRDSERARSAFTPFLAGLRELRNSLESDAERLRSGPAQELLSKTRESGRELLGHLAGIRAELDTMQAMLTPPGVHLEDKKPQ